MQSSQELLRKNTTCERDMPARAHSNASPHFQGVPTTSAVWQWEQWAQLLRDGKLRDRKFSPWDISKRVYFACSPEFAVGNFAPTCCEPTFGWWWLLLFADALPLSLRGLLFLPNELLVRNGGLLFLLGGLLHMNSWRAAVDSWWLAADCWWLLLLPGGCCYFLMHCCYLMATFFCFSSCGRAQQTYAT